MKLIISSVTSKEIGTKFIRAMNHTPVCWTIKKARWISVFSPSG